MTTRIVRFAGACGLAFAALSLIGCATSAPPVSKQAEGPTQSDLYMYVVDRAAKRTGTRVIWVNPPKGGDRARLAYSLEATVGDEDDS
jgi:hypothetical protein